MTDCVQLEPPLKLTPATSPRAPPFDHRSCCQMPTMLSPSVGFTSIQGSTSLCRNTVPDWPATLSAVQPTNALVPETWTSGPAMKGPAQAACGPNTAVTATTATATEKRFTTSSPPSGYGPLGVRGSPDESRPSATQAMTPATGAGLARSKR
jgi:hypothetical protein